MTARDDPRANVTHVTLAAVVVLPTTLENLEGFCRRVRAEGLGGDTPVQPYPIGFTVQLGVSVELPTPREGDNNE